MKKQAIYLQTGNFLSRIVLPIIFFLASLSAICQPSKWSILGGINSRTYTTSADGGVHALVKDQSGNIYAALGKGVYKWNGTEWSELEDYGFVLNPYKDVTALAVDNAGNVYAAADTLMGNNTKTYVVKWDGTRWIRLGEGTGGNEYFNLSTRSLATSPSGDLYAAMDGYIYKWDGVAWSMVFSYFTYSSTTGFIYSLVFDGNGVLYAAGSLTNVKNANSKKCVFKQDGNTWTELGTAINKLNANGEIRALAVDAGNNIYAAGAFTNAADQEYVAKWDGNTWTEIGAGGAGINAATQGSIYAIAVDALNNVYATGQLFNTDGASYVAKWDGTTWTQLGIGANADMYGYDHVLLVGMGATIYSQGGRMNESNNESYVTKWDGTKWEELGAGANVFNCTGTVYKLFADTATNNLYTGGYNAVLNNLSHLEKHDGTSWTPLSFPGYSDIVTAKLQRDAAGNFYAIGYYNFVGKWDGAVWSQFGTAFAGVNSINSLVIDKQDNVYVSVYSASLGKEYVAKWSGTEWVEVGGASPDPFRTTIVGKMIVDDSGNIYAVRADYIDFAYQYNVQKWDGTHWAQLGALNSNRSIEHLGVDSSGNLYATGMVNNDGQYISKWDGTSWSIVGGPGKNELNSSQGLNTFLVTPGGDIYVGGVLLGLYSESFMVKWNGTEWVNIGLINSRFAMGINAVAMDKQGNLYAAGDIKNSRGYNTIIAYKGKALPLTYTFNGNGNWSDAANWVSNAVPTNPVPTGTKVVIAPAVSGACILNVPVTIHGVDLTISTGANFRIQSNLTILK